MDELILAYVPESEHLTYAEARALAEERDKLAAEQLRLSAPPDATLRQAAGNIIITSMPESEKPRRDWMPLMLSEEWQRQHDPFYHPS